MKPADLVILLGVAVLLVLAVRAIRRGKGGCCGSCPGCTVKHCSHRAEP